MTDAFICDAIRTPIGRYGGSLALTATHALEKSNARRALLTLCVGVGQGVAVALERV
jgi:3-oxoadipyl-CoA thiolase